MRRPSTSTLGLAAALVVGLAVAGCAQDEPPDWLRDLDTTTSTTAPEATTTTDAGSPTTTGATETAAVTDLAVGDCVAGAPFSGEASGEATDAALADCAGEHDGEVVGLVTNTEGPDAAYPGQEAVASFAESECATAFEAYVGSAYGTSDLKMLSLWPTEDSWSGGDRKAVCVAYQDSGPLTGSVAGTAP